jgi:thioredoxin reductase (NADPH)
MARKVENFPGMECPLSGEKLVEKLLIQARNKRLPMELDACTSIDYQDELFVVNGASDEYISRTVLLATGVKPKRLIIDGIEDADRCLFYSWRELPHIKSARIAVIGGGEAAFDQACSLAELGAKVIILIRGHKPRAFAGLVDEARSLGVEILLNATVKLAARTASEILMQVSHPHNMQLNVDHILASIGITPSEISITEAAAARTDQGLYWAGDICSRNYRQAAIAFGDGIKKAMIAYEYLKG